MVAVMTRTLGTLACLLILHLPDTVAGQRPGAEPPIKEGLVLWLDAQALAAGNGQSVAEWRSRVGNVVLRQPEEARRPVCRDDLSPGRKLPKVVMFDGVRSSLLATDLKMDLHYCTVFVVAAPCSNYGGFRALLAGNTRGQSDFLSGFTIDLGAASSSRWERLNVEGKGFQGEQNLFKGGTDFGTFHVASIFCRPGRLGARLYVDGELTGQRPRQEGRLRIEELRLGVRHAHPGGGQPFDMGYFEGGIAEVLLYDAVLTEDDRQKVEAYLREKYAPLFQVKGLPAERLVHMLVPGFTVRELPVDLPNLNSLTYDNQGVLYAAGYDGRIHRLTDTDGDGLEDKAEIVWDQPTLRTPTALRWRPEGLYVVANGKVSLLHLDPGTGKAVKEEVIATGWVKDDGTTGGGVDALGLAFDKEGNLYFGLGCADYTNAYRLKEGKARYDLKSERGTILKVSADRKHREIVCTGIRFPYALAFNRYGDLFCTDQEGETWLPGGNPLDELNHIQPGKHYGFPPRHPQHLPQVTDEPPVTAFGPQHQSTCGMIFNDPAHPGGKTFGPDWWEGQALVAGFSRGKLWRVPLTKGPDGKFRGEENLFCCLKLLTLDLALSPQGDLVVCCHSGPPDWGVGPKGKGRLFKISYTQRALPIPRSVAADGPLDVRVVFDQELPPDWLDLARATIVYGEHVRAGDRFEVHKPPYKVVQEQEQAFRGKLRIITGRREGNEVILTTDPHVVQASYALTIPYKDGSGAIDLHYKVDRRAPWHPPPLPRATVVSGPPPELRGGDWERGRKLFLSKEANCSACHAVRGQGGTIGPDLSNLTHRDAASVLRDITEPSATINPDYVSYTVLLQNGKLYTGIVRTDGTDKIRVYDKDAKETILRREEIERLEASSLSAMPADVARQLSPAQLKDLLVYLTQPAPPPQPPLRTRAEVARLLRSAPPADPAAENRNLQIVLVAGPKDHGPGEHDYPTWQRQWLSLLGQVKNVTVTTAQLWPRKEQWQTAHVVVFYYWNHKWTKEGYQELDTFLARGGGIITLHSAVIEDQDPASLALRIGLAFSPRLKFRHGPLTLDFRADKEHPLIRGLTQLDFHDESYWFHTGDVQRVEVLATSKEDGQPRPMLWTYQPGKGRVVGCILGHYAWTFDDPLFRLLFVRSLAWTAQVPEQRFHPIVTLGVKFKGE